MRIVRKTFPFNQAHNSLDEYENRVLTRILQIMALSNSAAMCSAVCERFAVRLKSHLAPLSKA